MANLGDIVKNKVKKVWEYRDKYGTHTPPKKAPADPKWGGSKYGSTPKQEFKFGNSRNRFQYNPQERGIDEAERAAEARYDGPDPEPETAVEKYREKRKNRGEPYDIKQVGPKGKLPGFAKVGAVLGSLPVMAAMVGAEEIKHASKKAKDESQAYQSDTNSRAKEQQRKLKKTKLSSDSRSKLIKQLNSNAGY